MSTQGRIGVTEGACIFSTALVVSGLFGSEAQRMYDEAVPSYIALPIAITASAFIFLLVAHALKKSRSQSLSELFCYSLGNVAGGAASLVIATFNVLLVSAPLMRVIDILDSYLFQSTFANISFFVLPAIGFVAWMGFETLGRTAACFAIVLAMSLVAAICLSFKGYDTSRLYPIMSNNTGGFFRETGASCVAFIPCFMTALNMTRGMHGIKYVKKSALISTVIAVLACGVTELCISMSFPRDMIANTDMPLRSILLNVFTGNHIMRFDTFAIFIWLVGAMVSSAFYIYGAASFYAGTFKQKDSRPAVLGMVIIVMCILYTDHLSVIGATHMKLDTVYRYSFVVLIPLMVVVAVAALIKVGIKEKKAS